MGLSAEHQTGWTALVAHLILTNPPPNTNLTTRHWRPPPGVLLRQSPRRSALPMGVWCADQPWGQLDSHDDDVRDQIQGHLRAIGAPGAADGRQPQNRCSAIHTSSVAQPPSAELNPRWSGDS